MHEILISSPAFDTSKSDSYILSIQINLDGFSFSIRDFISNKFIYLKHIPIDAVKVPSKRHISIIQDEPLFKLSYKSVFVAYNLLPSTLVPESLFSEKEKETYYKLNYKVSDSSHLIHNNCTTHKSAFIFPIEEELYNLINSTFKHPEILHYNRIIAGLNTGFNNKEGAISLSIDSNRFSLMVYKDDSIILNNSYSYSNDDEFLYFFLYAFKQLNLDQHKTTVIIDGLVSKHAGPVTKLKQFIQNVEFCKWPEQFNYANDFYDLPSHYFHHLFLVQQCE